MRPRIAIMIGSPIKFRHIAIDMSTRLSQKIIAAHKKRDNWLLVELYTQAADSSADCDTECFFLTYAHIFSLEKNHPSLSNLKKRLERNGRE